ncbi:MAG: 3-hydroxyacyl-CoA dehydrogenase NAD-binding domain-containing protein, partial [Deltaproteobacteria bacterium]|nr:3-hydroxyacyl-CoA dehydrogenase NAD-binding domain-containing protein [Deltaproteobacteria bacterium]
MAEIKNAAVIGSGVMGSGIAAHLANAGVPVVLMDIVPAGAKNRNAIAEGAVERLLRSDPPAFMHKRAVKLVTPANVADHLDMLASVDWIIEAVVEDLATKRALYQRIEKTRKEGSIVSSNTSTLPLARLVEGLPERF